MTALATTNRDLQASTPGRSASAASVDAAGRSRVVLENPTPCVDGGRFAGKRSVGERIRVEVDAFTDGHDKVSVALLHRTPGSATWDEIDMTASLNDRWFAEFEAHAVGPHEFTVKAWVDRFATWSYDFKKRVTAGQNVSVDLLIGAELVAEAANEASGEVGQSLAAYASLLKSDERGPAIEAAVGESLAKLMRQHAPRPFVTELPSPVQIWVDRAKARFSSWYEFFPRSASFEPGKHGTLKDVTKRLDYVAKMGFDVCYLPPIHPIGRAFRKGKNNSPVAELGDVGSPWAIGGPEGGHDAIHPDLGTLDDFDAMVNAGKERGVEIALDLAFQCSPDHPYVKQHPEWFKHRPDGTIQYAENPPKKYQDIYPFDFECKDWQALWQELLRVLLFWNDRGIKIFRVDNPHTKPFPFWEWLIGEAKKHDPDLLFLAEAFTRPKVMYRLAKLGFTQSYTYFAWRNEPWALKQYMTELTQGAPVDFFRPNVWPNTPDILPEYLQTDARSAYVVRAILAATIGANYGVYGPAFELMDPRPVRPGAEEYIDSEKYQLRQWDYSRPDALGDLLGRLNAIRKLNPALQHDRTLRFHHSDNDRIVCFSKVLGNDAILVVVNTDPYQTQWSRLWLDLKELGIAEDQSFQVHDLLTDARYQWQGAAQNVGLDPGSLPAHVFAIRRRQRSESDFDYYL